MTLTEGQLSALRNLSSKKAGSEVDWISIADARSLTELGLAERNREGWNITAEGESYLSRQPPPSGAADTGSAPEEA